ncbi:hypothetical protein [Aliamphritea hakodatensis]|uniref:hypothetical protein n=1 Tax=Aliamphritea hakodatensis TaxID=2895352 RepID=UPI0022FDAAEF|nr:hypothetical protein [Aliamphritea hakodatensis]
MRYITGVVLPAVLQCLFVFIVVAMNTGNGSWVGLGVFLLAIFAIPGTAIINALYIRSHPDLHTLSVINRCLLLALAVPLLTPVFLFAL